MNIESVKKLALDCGFKLKEQSSGDLDLNQYVYSFAEQLTAGLEKDRDELKAQVEKIGRQNIALSSLVLACIDGLEFPDFDRDLFDVCFHADSNLAAHDAEVAAKTEQDFIKAIFYAPSSPVSAKKAQEIEEWYGKVKQLRQQAKAGE